MTLLSFINLKIVKSLAKIKSSSSNSSIKEKTSSLICLIILRLISIKFLFFILSQKIKEEFHSFFLK